MPDIFDENEEPDEELEQDEQDEQELEDQLANLDAFTSAVPSGAYVTIRNGASNPIFVNLYQASEYRKAETSITVREAFVRAALALSPATTIYVENNVVDMNYVLAAGAVVTVVGSVKGGLF